jgi:hypothetical protein
LTVKCVPTSWSIAHVCDRCGAVGPTVGYYTAPQDEVDWKERCTRDGRCAAATAGWLVGEEDLCPACRKRFEREVQETQKKIDLIVHTDLFELRDPYR